MGSAALDQLALADFIERGELDRFLRRMRPIYRARRDALLAALARHHPGVRPVGASAGLHVLAWLPPDIDESAVVARAAATGSRSPASASAGSGPRCRASCSAMARSRSADRTRIAARGIVRSSS